MRHWGQPPTMDVAVTTGGRYTSLLYANTPSENLPVALLHGLWPSALVEGGPEAGQHALCAWCS
jgi:hypothetical protein